MLRQIATELEKRSISNQIGGWSTNHVEPMSKLAKELFAHLGRGGSDTDPTKLRQVGEKMEDMIDEVRSGGWSTQNLDFFEKTSEQVFAHLGRYCQ